MQNEWILDVLADLKTFAQKNGLGALAEQLDDTRYVASTELAASGKETCTHDDSSANAVGQSFEFAGKRL